MAKISGETISMTIQDGLKLKPNFLVPYYGFRGVDMPDVTRNDLPKFLYESGCRVGVEIGINQGEYGIELCKAGLKVYGIDPYMSYKGYTVRRFVNYYKQAIKNLKDYNYTIIKKFSMDALSDFKDESLDFVYIDGNHTLPYIVDDIFGWEPKLRKGGIMSGHDYAFVTGVGEKRVPKIYDGTHVKAAVDMCAYIMRVEKLYVLGKRYLQKNDKPRDKWRSWFWIKN